MANWIGNGLMTTKQGEQTAATPEGGFLLFVAGRIISKDGSLGSYFSHRRPNIYWYSSQDEAMTALLVLAQQEEVAKHPIKPEIDLRKPGIVEAGAWVSPNRW